MMLAAGCIGLLALSAPAFGKPAAKDSQHKQQTEPADHKKKPAHQAKSKAKKSDAARLVSMPVTQAPKRPAFGWPALVAEARKYMGTNPTDRQRLWCATFMNMVLAKVGYAGTNSDAARSFAQYGHRISQPKVGAIAVLTRGKNGGHVGVVSGIDANGNPIIISGNHGKRVGEAVYPRNRVIAYVMPSDRRGPTQVAERDAPRSTPSDRTSIDSPITELIAAIEAEQAHAERPPSRPVNPARAARPAQAPEQPHLTVQQTPERASRKLPLDPELAQFLGIKSRS
jgi:uncharacterized protein (TIGR02594 family)